MVEPANRSLDKNIKEANGRVVLKFLLLPAMLLVSFAALSQSVVTNVGSSTTNGTYGVGATISIQVTFNEVVNVTGTPQLNLETGINDRLVNYTSGTGTTTLTFTYTVANGDYTGNHTAAGGRLSYPTTTSLFGTIQNAALVQANLTLPAIGALGSLSFNDAIVIDETQSATVSAVTSTTANGTWFQGQVITITVDFNEPVIVTGTPRLQLETGTTDQFVNYSSGSGNTTGTLTFLYTIQAGDASSDLDYVSTAALTLNGGTILDQSGNTSTLTLATPGTTNSLGANKSLVISGIPPPTPATQASAIGFSGIGTTSLILSAISGDGQRRIVLAKATSAVDASPVNGTGYTASNTFGGGTQIGTGNYVIFDGSGSVSLTVFGLSANTIYHFKVFEYNGQTTNSNYNTSNATGNPASRTTLATEPSSNGTISFGGSTDVSATLNFTAGNGSSRIIVGFDDTDCCPSAVDPTDGTTYVANTAFGLGGTTGFTGGGSGPVPTWVLFSGSGTTSIQVTNLRPSTEYDFDMYEFNGSGGGENYRSTSASTPILTTQQPTNPRFFSGDAVASSINATAVDVSAFSFSYYPNTVSPAINVITINQGSANQVADWSEVISSATLRVERTGAGGGVTGCASTGFDGTIGATSITFTTTGSCSAFWDPNETNAGTFYQLEITLNSSLSPANAASIDGRILAFSITNSSFVLASAGSMHTSNVEVSTAIPIQVTAAKLRFVQQPPSTIWTGAAMSPAITVEATDNNNNRDLDFVSAVGLTSTGTLASAQSATFSAGFGTYSNVVHSATGSARTISTTNSSALANATSSAFSVVLPLELSPNVMTLYPRASSPEKIVMTLSKAPTLASGANVTGFTTSTGAIASAVYTDNAGSAPFVVTLTSAANSQWTTGTTIGYTNGTGNLKDAFNFEMYSISGHSVVIETAPPAISSVSIPNVPMKVGDVVTSSITTASDDGDDAILVGGMIGGVPDVFDGFLVGNLINTNSTSKTVQFTIAEGGTDLAASAGVPVYLQLKDGQDNTSTLFQDFLVQANDAIDANSPKVASINRQSVTNGWSSTSGSSASSVVFRVTFSENIDGTSLNADDFTIPVTGTLSGAAITSIVAQTGTSVYDVTAGSYTGTGTLGLSYIDNNDNTAVKDLAGNFTIKAINDPDGDFAGQTFSIVLPEPTNHVTTFSASAISASQARVTWMNASTGNLPTHLLIVATQTGFESPYVIGDGLSIAPEEDFSNGTGVAIVDLVANPTQTSYTFSNMIAAAQYGFTIYPYSLSSSNTSDNIDYKIGSNPTATATLFKLTVSPLNSVVNELASSPLSAGTLSQAILGFSLASDGTQVVSSIRVNTSSTPVGKLSNFSLVRSNDNVYTTGGDNVNVTGLTFTPSPSEILITGLSETITSVKNYFLVADVPTSVNGASAALTCSFTEANLTLDIGFVSTATITGIDYSFTGSQQSDIVFSSGTSSNILYNNFQTASGLTSATTASLATFQIRDGGGIADVDNLNTTLSSLTLQFSNHENLRRVALFDGTTNIAELDVTTDIVSFSTLALSATDNVTKLFSVRATFKSQVTDNQNIQVSIIGATTANTGSGFASTDAGGAATSGSVNRIVVTADRLSYLLPPTSTFVNQNFGLTVNSVDVNLNTDTDYAGAVTLSKLSGAGNLSSTDAGGLSRTITAGAVSWTQLQLSAVGSYTIRATSGSLTQASVVLSAVEPANEPTVQTTAIVFSSVSSTSLTVNFTNGNGSGRLLVAREGSPVDANPSDGIAYSVSNAFGAGDQIGSGNYAMATGSGPISITGLTPGLTYHFRVFEFNGSAGTENYLTSSASGNPGSQATSGLSSEPTTQATSIIFSSILSNSIMVNYTNGNGNSRFLVAKVGSPVDAVLTDGVTYSANNAFGAGGLIGSGNYVVGVGSGPITVTGLAAGNTYHFRVFEFNGSGGNENYLTASASGNPASQATSGTPSEPTSQASALTFSGLTSSSMVVSFTNGNGTSRLLVARAGAAINSDPADGITYTANTAFGTGSEIGTGNFAVGMGSGPITVTGLAAGVQYHFRVYEYSGASGAENYLTSSSTGNPASKSTISTEPTTQATSITFASSGQTSVSVQNTNGNGTSRIILAREGSAVNANPVDGAGYSPNTLFGSGSQIGTGNYVVHSGAGGVNVSGLTPGSTYHFQIFEFNGSAGTENYLTTSAAGNPASYAVPLDNTPPVINSTTQQTANAGETITISATITDSESAITSAMAEFRSISSGGATTSRPLTPSGSTYTCQVTSSEAGELGIEFKLSATSSGGTQADETWRTVRLNHVNNNNGLPIPYTSFGSAESNYRIISVPLSLTSNTVADVFNELMPYDKTKWRMYHYQSGTNQELNGSSTILPGKGYWLIVKDGDQTFNSGPGTTVPASSDAPFTITLTGDWNQIGNPYNFNMLWSDVVAANPGIGLPANMRIYDGAFDDGTVLNKMEGAFIRMPTSQGTQTLKFPTTRNASVNGGRVKEEKKPFMHPLDQPDWQVYLSLRQGSLINRIAGFGMNRKASATVDPYDGFTMPRFFENYLEVNHTKTDGADHYSTDIVPPMKNHVWEFSVESSSQESLMTFTWDNSYFGANDMQLCLWDNDLQRATDMRKEGSYAFDKNATKSFKVIFGSPEFLKDQTSVLDLVLHSVSPNPSDGDVTFSFSLPESDTGNALELSVSDLLGRKIWLNHAVLGGGYHQMTWKREKDLLAGVYLVTLNLGKVSRQARLVLK